MRRRGPRHGTYELWRHVSVQPSRTTVISVAAATALLVVGTAATAVGTSYRHVTVEVDGVTHDVSGFFTTAGDALSTAGVSVGAHDLVAPASDQRVASGDTVVVRTATEYDVTVDGNQTTAWSTAPSISGVLAALPASAASMAADRSYTRAEMPVAETGDTIHVIADGTTTDVVASSSEGTTAILEKAGVSAGPIDRVTLENKDGETNLRVARVVRGTVSTTTEIPYETEEREDAAAEEGTEKTVQEGVAGSEVTEAYQETIDGNVTVSAVLSTTRTEPTKRIVSKGTKAKKTEDTSASSSSGSSSSGSSASAPAAVSGDDAAIWAAIAQCESGGNPSINTGNGYYGMYQFSLPTWRSVGGSGLPSDASVEEQTMRARMLQQRSGWGQWGCAYKLGLV